MMRWTKDAATAKWVLVAYWVLMYFGTHYPDIENVKREMPFWFSGMSFLIHAVMYSGWAALCVWVVSVSRRRYPVFREFALIWVVGTAYAIFDECTQLLVGRTGKPIDVGVDLAAMTTVLLLAWLLLRPAGGATRGGA